MKKISVILICIILILSMSVVYGFIDGDGGSGVIGEGVDFIGLRVPDYPIAYGAMYGFEGFKSQEIEIELENTGSLDIRVIPVWDSGDVFKYIKFRDEISEDYIAAGIDRSFFSTFIPMSYEIVEEEYVFSNPWLLTTWIKLNEVIEVTGAQEGVIYFSARDVGNGDIR